MQIFYTKDILLLIDGFDNLDDSRLNSKELGKKPLPKYSELRSASKYLSIFENTDLDIDTLFLKLYALLKPNEYVKYVQEDDGKVFVL